MNGRLDVIDTAVTDAFGGFTLKAAKPGKYSIVVRRSGFLPILTESFALTEGPTLTDTVFLEGTQAERGIKDVISESVRRTFGGGVLTTFWRFIGPEDIEPARDRLYWLGDLVRLGGKQLGVQHVDPPGGCFRFVGQRRCAQIFVNGVPVFLSPDQIATRDLEAVVAIRPEELGSAITSGRLQDNSRYGVVLVFTTDFIAR